MNNDESQSESAGPDLARNPTLRLLYERASVRAFLDKDIEEPVLQAVLRAGAHAPTGGNLQPYSIIKIKDPVTRSWLAEKCGQKFIGSAPVNLLFCLDYHRLKQWARVELAPFTCNESFRHFWIGFQDVVIAAQNICTAADAAGLGSVYIGTVLEFIPELKERFNLQAGVCPVVLLVMGYPRVYPEPRPKLPVEVVVHEESYRGMSDDEVADAFETKFPIKDRPDRHMPLTEERRRVISDACRQAHGSDFARTCLERIAEIGYVPMAHRYFGLHYCGHQMPRGNDKFIRQIRDCGFSCFDKWVPVEE